MAAAALDYRLGWLAWLTVLHLLDGQLGAQFPDLLLVCLIFRLLFCVVLLQLGDDVIEILDFGRVFESLLEQALCAVMFLPLQLAPLAGLAASLAGKRH